MLTKNEKIVLAIHNRLMKKFPDYAGLFFYGSRTRKNYRTDSDYDIFLTFKDKIDWKKNEVWEEIALFELENDVATDTKIYNYTELNMQNTPYRESVVKSGIFYGV
jgi:hypothetical protein